jgi:TPR repeat protein
MQRIDDGLAYLDRLIENDLFYDSLGVLLLEVAHGYEMDEDLLLAEATYEDITDRVTKGNIVAQAYYRLGLIQQYDYDNLNEAKKYYDQAVEAGRSSEAGNLALQKSSDIGKLETYKQGVDLDSTATEEAVNEAARTQYLLSELYWFQLNKPESALVEMSYLIDEYPESDIAPQAIIALSQMYRDHRTDTTAADSLLRTLLQEYPHADEVPRALDQLGLRGTAADTGYAELYIHKAEEFLLEDENPDSAMYYYQYVADNFPDSKYWLQAQFSALFVQEEYALPGDSSLVFGYRELVDSFPNTEWANLARMRLGAAPVMGAVQTAKEQEAAQGEVDKFEDEQALDTTDQVYASEFGEGGSYVDVQTQMYLRPNGDTVILLEEEPVLIEEPFEFPSEAFNMEEDYIFLYYQILLDFSGRVIEYDLKVPSRWDELNTRASRTVASMTFDPIETSRLVDLVGQPPDPSGQGHWFLFKYRVDKPEHLR